MYLILCLLTIDFSVGEKSWVFLVDCPAEGFLSDCPLCFSPHKAGSDSKDLLLPLSFFEVSDPEVFPGSVPLSESSLLTD